LLAVDCRCAGTRNIVRKGARARLERDFVLGKLQIHGRDHNPLPAGSLQVNQPLGLTFYCSAMPLKRSAVRLLTSAAVATVLSFAAGGCSNIGGRDVTGSIGQSGSTAVAETESRKSLEPLSARYRDNPGDPNAAIAYASALRASDQRAQAVAVLEQATIRN